MKPRYISRNKLTYTQMYNLVGFKVMTAYQNGRISLGQFEAYLTVAIQEHNKNE